MIMRYPKQGPYVSEEDEPAVWIIRGDGDWPAIQRTARTYLTELGGEGPMDYHGIRKDVRVSDEREDVHGDDDACGDAMFEGDTPPEGWTPCCRTVEVYEFTAAWDRVTDRRCYLCKRSEPIRDGTYVRVSWPDGFVRDICDDCYAKGNEPDEWLDERLDYEEVEA